MRSSWKGLMLALLFVGLGANPLPAQSNPIEWTHVPKVDQEDPTIHRGIVYDADGEPLEGAEIFAASNIELFEIRSAEEVSPKDLGAPRTVTDELGRFEFRAPDLTWTTTAGEQKRWEAYIVATKDGFAPGWIKTWGQDRGLRSHWHPHISKDVVIHMTIPTKFDGYVYGPDGKPLADARIKLKSVHLPYGRDLDKHIEKLRKYEPTLFSSGVGYQESIYRPWLIPGQSVEVTANKEGQFFFEGLPKDHLIQFEISHPKVQTTSYSAATRLMETTTRAAHQYEKDKSPKTVLRGTGNEFTPPVGVTLRGTVVYQGMFNGQPVPAGVTVAMANHNTANGMAGEKFFTNEKGRFEITGLRPGYSGLGYTLAIIGSYEAPVESKRVTVAPNRESKVEVFQAVPYQLTLTDEAGNPIDRKVFSISVQRYPGQKRKGPSSRYHIAKRVKPGVYQGIVPKGPAAVMVERKRYDRPAFVDPKEYFEPGRSDWTAEEMQFAYGNQWQIVQPAVTTTEKLAPQTRKHNQLGMAAIVLTNGPNQDQSPLELKATVIRDQPRQVEVVDSSGQPVEGVRIRRRLPRSRYKDLPSKFTLAGLHPQRGEWIQFFKDEKQLIGVAKVKLEDQPLRIVMKPYASIRGSIVDAEGKPTRDFTIFADGALPDQTYLTNQSRATKDCPKNKFHIRVAPDKTYSGRFMRRTYRSSYPRPLLGPAFGPVTPKPGEQIDLGNLQVDFGDSNESPTR